MDNEKVKQFVIAVRTRAKQDEIFSGTSDKSRKKLIILLNKQLRNKDNRIRVLQAITGLPITTQNNLTQWMTSVLIDQVINANTRNETTLMDIERALEEHNSTKGTQPAWELFPWERPEITLSDMS